MAHRIPAPIWFNTRPSRILAAYIGVLHALAFAALFPTPLPAWALVTAAVGLTFHGAWCVRGRAFQRGAAGVKALHWQADGAWRVLAGDGRMHRYTHVLVRMAHPWLILVELGGAKCRPRTLVLAADSADAEVLRRLRVRLRGLQPGRHVDQDRPLAGT